VQTSRRELGSVEYVRDYRVNVADVALRVLPPDPIAVTVIDGFEFAARMSILYEFTFVEWSTEAVKTSCCPAHENRVVLNLGIG
jgi:hypothetical protein